MFNHMALYQDLRERTNGEIYLGVVGPVRTGKSTFIKHFMELLVLPNMKDVHNKNRTIDELPQSAQGTTIMTTEPKFVPKEAVNVVLGDSLECKFRLVDCVGFMVEGAMGHIEDGKERMVKTPWFPYDIPFAKAAEIGTEKVIKEHATIGVLVTTDGSFGAIAREKYEPAEEKTIEKLRAQGKPFVVILNSAMPDAQSTKDLADGMTERYGCQVLPIDVEHMSRQNVIDVLEAVLMEFPITEVQFNFPRWIEALSADNPMKEAMIDFAMELLGQMNVLQDLYMLEYPESEYIDAVQLGQIDSASGVASLKISMKEDYYYKVLSEVMGERVENEFDFMEVLKGIAEKKAAYEKVACALESAQTSGYGCVTPGKSEIHLEKPEVIKHGSKYGVKLSAQAPSLHFIKANVSTEIAPIVGTKEQAEDLIKFMEQDTGQEPENIWDVNIFGKSVDQLIEEGMKGKTSKLSAESQLKLQESMEKIVNEGNGGLVCFII